jgi:hypothetical protein
MKHLNRFSSHALELFCTTIPRKINVIQFLNSFFLFPLWIPFKKKKPSSENCYSRSGAEEEF